MRKAASLLGLTVAAQESSADLSKLSGLLEPGSVVQTLSGDAYRVASKVASADGFSFRLADLNGKQVQTPANFHPVSAAFARTAAWMRFVFAFNSDFDLYVKEYIRAAGLPVDDKMNWAKWFQYKYQAKLNWLTQDPEILDEAIHQVIITALAHRKDLTKFDPKRLPADLQKKPVAEQVTAYLEWLFGKRVSEAKEFIQEKLQPQEEVSMYQPGEEEEGGEGEMNLLDTEEHAQPSGAEGVHEQSDLARLRDQFAAYLQEDESPREIEKILVVYDYFAANVGHKLKISDYEKYWKEKTGLGFDSLKPVYSKFYRYIPDFMVATGMMDQARATAWQKAMAEQGQAQKAKGQAVGVKSSLNIAAAEEQYTSDAQVIPTPAQAGPADTELQDNAHTENGVQVLDGELKSPERPNVNAMREALDTQAEMEVGMPIEQKEEEIAQGGTSETKTVDVPAGAKIVININAASMDVATPHPYDGPGNTICQHPGCGRTKNDPVHSEKARAEHSGREPWSLHGSWKTAADFRDQAQWEAAARAAGATIETFQKDEMNDLNAIKGGTIIGHYNINVKQGWVSGIEDPGQESPNEQGGLHAEDEFMGHGFQQYDHEPPTPEQLQQYGLSQEDMDEEDPLSIYGDTQFFRRNDGWEGSYSMDEGDWSLALHGQAVAGGSIGDGSLKKELDAKFGQIKQSGDQDQVDRTGDKEVDFNTKDAAGAMCQCGHHKTYHDGKNKMCHGGTKDEPCNCDGRFKPKKEGAAGAAPALAPIPQPKKVVLRRPTDSEMEHERMRFNQAYKSGDTEQYLERRLRTIQNPQKLFAFALMLENENWHTFNKQVFEKLKQLGWDGSWPKGASAKKTAGQHNWVIKDKATVCEHCGAPWDKDHMSGECPQNKTSGYGDTGAFPHNPEGGDGHTGPDQPIVVDTKEAAPVMQAPRQPAQGPQQKSYGTPVGEKKDTDVIDPTDPDAQDSGSGFEKQPRRKTIMPELPNAEMILQLNSSLKIAECEPGNEDACAQIPWGNPAKPMPWEDIKRSSEDMVTEEMSRMAHEKNASYAQELLEDFIDEAMGQEFLWVSGREKGMRFAPRSIDQMGSDPHLRGSYTGHPQFGNIPDDMHQVAALMDDLENGSCVVEADPRATESLKNLASEYNEAQNDEFEEGEEMESYPEDPMTDEEFAEGGTVEAATKVADPAAGAAPAPAPEEGDDYPAVGPFHGNLVKYDQEDFVALVNSKYGWAVSGQADAILNGEDPEDQNSNALNYIAEFAKRKGETELAQYLYGYLTTIGYKHASVAVNATLKAAAEADKTANPLATVPKVDVSPAPSAPMAAPVANSKRAELRNKIASRKAARAAAKLSAVKVARLRQVAADEPDAAGDGLEQLGNAFGELAQSVNALRQNLDLVPFNPEEHNEMPIPERIAAAREASTKFATEFRRFASEDPAAIGAALSEVLHGVDEVRMAIENYAENLGVELGEPQQPSVGPESEEKQLKDEEEHQEEPKAEEKPEEKEEKEGDGPAFTNDRDHAGHPREASFDIDAELTGVKEGADGSNNFVTDRDDKGEPKQPFRVEVPRI